LTINKSKIVKPVCR